MSVLGQFTWTISLGSIFAASLCGWMASGRQGWLLIFTHMFAALFGASASLSTIAWVLS